MFFLGGTQHFGIKFLTVHGLLPSFLNLFKNTFEENHIKSCFEKPVWREELWAARIKAMAVIQADTHCFPMVNKHQKVRDLEIPHTRLRLWCSTSQGEERQMAHITLVFLVRVKKKKWTVVVESLQPGSLTLLTVLNILSCWVVVRGGKVETS